VDEAAVKRSAAASGASAAMTALRLARLKAQSVPCPGGIVLGCDQILVADGAWFDKPATLSDARTQLLALRGRRHVLATAVVALREGVELWQHVAMPGLVMRPFSDDFLDAYLAAEGDQILGSVGAYRLEGLGIQLFESVDGEHAAILGLPMLPLLAFLREQGVIVG
jgi:septum formation protein